MRSAFSCLASLLLTLAVGSFANAAFTFSPVSINIRDVPGTGGTVEIFATKSEPIEIFRLTGFDVVEDNLDPDINITSVTPDGLNQDKIVFDDNPFLIGSFTYEIGVMASFLDQETFTVVIEGLTSGPVLAPPSIPNDGSIAGTITAVPEPSTLGLLAMGSAGLAFRRRRS